MPASNIDVRIEARRQSYARELRDAKYGLFIWRAPGCDHVGVRDLETDQIKKAIQHFDRRKYECVEELARRAGQPIPNFRR